MGYSSFKIGDGCKCNGVSEIHCLSKGRRGGMQSNGLRTMLLLFLREQEEENGGPLG